MMDENHPSSGFAEPLAAPAQTEAAWAFDRDAAALKPSSNYGAAHLGAEPLQSQSYQLPTYTTAQVRAAGRTLESSSNTSVTSIISFLSAMESRSVQPSPVSASLLPPFRSPSWPNGHNSSTTELYLTGALPSTATFPSPAALPSFQHTGAYPSRSYATGSSTALHDHAFSTPTNGLFSHHDPLLHLKPSQAALSTALVFNSLSAPSLGSNLPVQSSTYRSAQESAPHLLQPQFSLLSSSLPTAAPAGALQPYEASVFSGSIERALQRECSVIKHHHRPSITHVASEQLLDSEHPLQGYFGSDGEAEVSYQPDPAPHIPLSSGASSTQGVSGSPQHDTDCVTQLYSSESLLKGKECTSQLNLHTAGDDERHSQNLRMNSSECYPSSAHKHSSVIANQQAMHFSSLTSKNLSQTYVTPQTQSQPTGSTSEKSSSLYDAIPAHSSQSDNVSSVGQTLGYSATPGLNQDQIQFGLCEESFSERYPTSHSEGGPNLTFSSLSQGQTSATRPQSFDSVQSLRAVYTPTCLSTQNSSVDYCHIQLGETPNSLSHEHTKAHSVLSTPLPTYSSPSQSLESNIRSPLQGTNSTYANQKLEALPPQDMEALQHAPVVSVADNCMSAHNVIGVLSKVDDRKPQSVIRSNSHSDEQFLGLSHKSSVELKDEHLDSLSQRQGCLSSASNHEAANTKTTNSAIVRSLGPLVSEQLNQQLATDQMNQQNQQTRIPSAGAHFVSVPSSQVVYQPHQMTLLQQSLAQQSQTLVSVQGLQPGHCLGQVHVQYPRIDQDTLGPNLAETQSHRASELPESASQCTPSSKHHYNQPLAPQPSDIKNQFSINSLCFPDSMLLADDRNMLSNVDDILAATVAACGVTPQDFLKATSSAESEITRLTSPVDSKVQLQTVGVRRMSPTFSSEQHPVTTTNCNTISMTLNGVQEVSDCRGPLIHHDTKTVLDTNRDGVSSENSYQYVTLAPELSGIQSQVKGSAKCIATQDGTTDYSGAENSLKKKVHSKSSNRHGGVEDDEALTKLAKGSAQTKHQNSRGTDASLPSSSNSVFDSSPQQEKIRQKIREVEEKQPEVKSGFIGSFLDFLKSGPKQQYAPTPTKTVSRPRKPSNSSKSCPLPSKIQTFAGPLLPQESQGIGSSQKRLDEDFQKNLETLPSFSSDDEESTGKNQALRNSITSALSALDEASDRKTRTDNQVLNSTMKPEPRPTLPLTVMQVHLLQVAPPVPAASIGSGGKGPATKQEFKQTSSEQRAQELISVAMEGLTDEELSDSGGEGMYRERDEFVVRNEDIETLKVTMREGTEPPAIWKVQKALLQKFVPELRDTKRVFSATNSVKKEKSEVYLGYFGDAKTMYQRVYVKFLDTVNKRECVRICSRKPRCKPMNSLRGIQMKALLGLTALPSPDSQNQKVKPKQVKLRAEPPPKKRKKWKEEFSPTPSASSVEEEINPSFASRILNTRTMKETFKSFVELLVSVALDEDVMSVLERANDEFLLPHMKRVDGMISDNRKRLLNKLRIGQVLKTALDSFPEISVVTEMRKDEQTPAFKVRLSGRTYNKKTMKPHKMPNKVPQEYTVDQQKTQWFSLYHSLQHYKYHTYLMCKEEIASLRVQAGELGQEETVQKCLQNGAWVEGLFDHFGKLISQVQQVCR